MDWTRFFYGRVAAAVPCTHGTLLPCAPCLTATTRALHMVRRCTALQIGLPILLIGED
jgi:hypothetical protein